MDSLVYDRMDAQEAVHWWFAARRALIGRMIERLVPLPAHARLLEAGCGTGGNLGLLRRFGSVDAFECEPGARARAQAKSGLPVAAGALPDAVPAGFGAGGRGYDLIGLFDVLEHVGRDVAALNRLGGLLAPGGRILLTVPALPWMWSHHDEAHHHFRRYSRAGLIRTARAAGLRVEHCFHFNGLLLPVAAGMRLVKRLSGSTAPDDALPPAWLNRLLYRVFAAERHLVGRLALPLGLSLAAVLARGGDAGRR